MKVKVLGICAAQGAMLFPFKRHLLANIEPRGVFHTPKEEQWKLNFGEIPFLKSLEQYKGDQPDIIIGSPSCGHSSVFSYSRKKTLGKPREDKTLTLYIEAINKFEPKIFLLENLPKLIDLIPLREWEQKLSKYHLVIHCHSVFDFGNSQKSRKRLIMMGIRTDSEFKTTDFTEIFKVSKPFLVKDIPNMIDKKLNFTENDDKKLAMYHYNDPKKTTLTVKQVRELWNGEFKDEFKWPMKTQKMKTLPGVYRNRKNTYPLTVRPSSRQFNPEGNPMGLEEYKIIMGFPKKFKIYFNSEDKTYWLNKGRNTITKGSVYEVGKWFKLSLRKSISRIK